MYNKINHCDTIFALVALLNNNNGKFLGNPFSLSYCTQRMSPFQQSLEKTYYFSQQYSIPIKLLSFPPVPPYSSGKIYGGIVLKKSGVFRPCT